MATAPVALKTKMTKQLRETQIVTAIEEARDKIDGIEGSEGWVAVAHASESEGWDWSAISFYYSPSARRYFWYSDGGCSCNWHMDGTTYAADFFDGDRQAAIEAAKDWGTECEAEVRDFKPEQ